MNPRQHEMFTTPDSIKAHFESALRRGEKQCCPTCGRYAQIYRRRIHTSIALQLITLYRLGGDANFIHASELIAPGIAGAGALRGIRGGYAMG